MDLENESETMQETAELAGNGDEVTEVDTTENPAEDAENTAEETEATTTGTTEQATEQTTEQPTEKVKPQRDFESDSAYAKIRRRAEQAERERDKLQSALKHYFDGANIDEMADRANAYANQITYEEQRQRRLSEEQETKQKSQLENELRYYQEKEIAEMQKKDLAEIQKINPNIKSLDELGDDYFDLISKGIDGVKAYKLLHLDDIVAQKSTKAEQDTISKINANSKASVGSLSGGENKPVDYSSMSDAEFEKVVAKAKRGELKKY